MSRSTPRPIVIIGAARSGTKILRDSLAAAAAAGAVPYDVGFIWRYGNESSPHDMLSPEVVKPKTRRLVKSYLAKYARNGVVVEKTVGNTLRVPFVASVLPDASFVYVERDGVDVAVSTRREWLAPNDYRYLVEKARHFPIRLLPTYGVKFARAQTVGRDKSTGHVATWGPRYPGIDHDLMTADLLEVCARQWRTSVLAARADLESRPGVVRVNYQDLVDDPAASLAHLVQSLGLPFEPARVERAAGMIDARAARPARADLTAADRTTLSDEIGPLLEELGYDAP
jgi:hypothetical protein